mmetsp:Transcript_4145/g.13483  ORF Transcript_4145/g.13483 Transcript_4145/m.13483 type:complete len:242 (+) Transcript_4145:818-1543(+)
MAACCAPPLACLRASTKRDRSYGPADASHDRRTAGTRAARRSASSSVPMSSMRPMDKALPTLVSALPLTIMARARLAPTRRGSRCVPPAPGMRPSFTSGRPMARRSGEAMRMWAARASSRPPPRGVPCRKTTTGLAELSMRKSVSLRSGVPAREAPSANSRMSAPATKVLPVAEMRAARTAGSVRTCSMAACRPDRTWDDRALTGGLSMRMCRRPVVSSRLADTDFENVIVMWESREGWVD